MADGKGVVRRNMEPFWRGYIIALRYGAPVSFLVIVANLGARFGLDAAFCAFGAACSAVVGCWLWLNWAAGLGD